MHVRGFDFSSVARAAMIPRRPMLKFPLLIDELREKIHAPQDKIRYEYLDGKTKDRQARVDRFQSDPDCKVFLISLKAGGVGLNDRTHRICQTKQVFACRLIAKDTVEEKVLQLQQSKRALADAIIGQDNSVISTLGKAELELLLS